MKVRIKEDYSRDEDRPFTVECRYHWWQKWEKVQSFTNFANANDFAFKYKTIKIYKV